MSNLQRPRASALIPFLGNFATNTDPKLRRCLSDMMSPPQKLGSLARGSHAAALVLSSCLCAALK